MAAGPPPLPHRKTILRSLGEFFGHIAQAVRTDPAASAPGAETLSAGEDRALPQGPGPLQLVRRSVEEKQVETPAGPVTLRRTVIDELELPGDRPFSPPPPPSRS